MPKLNFEKQQDPCGEWRSGIYKIVRYEKDSLNNGRPTYRAYYILKGETMWGYYVDPKTQFYTRLADAQATCRRHARTY